MVKGGKFFSDNCFFLANDYFFIQLLFFPFNNYYFLATLLFSPDNIYFFFSGNLIFTKHRSLMGCGSSRPSLSVPAVEVWWKRPCVCCNEGFEDEEDSLVLPSRKQGNEVKSCLSCCCLLFVFHVPTMYQSSTNHVPSIYQASTNHLPTIYQPSTNHLPTIYQPCCPMGR